jgi:anti-anti-sigma regulatory factor
MDFSRLNTFDSMGLGVIIAANNAFEMAGGKLSLTMSRKSFMRFAKQCAWTDILK